MKLKKKTESEISSKFSINESSIQIFDAIEEVPRPRDDVPKSESCFPYVDSPKGLKHYGLSSELLEMIEFMIDEKVEKKINNIISDVIP
jgi:hypothetical protein